MRVHERTCDESPYLELIDHERWHRYTVHHDWFVNKRDQVDRDASYEYKSRMVRWLVRYLLKKGTLSQHCLICVPQSEAWPPPPGYPIGNILIFN